MYIYLIPDTKFDAHNRATAYPELVSGKEQFRRVGYFFPLPLSLHVLKNQKIY